MNTIDNTSELLIEEQNQISLDHLQTIPSGIIANWSCPICDGDNETGCLMSDPQHCPYGKGW
jgi:hypothetical protein